MPTRPACLVLGAGPAGLTAAHELTRAGRACRVVESDPEYVGGIARTVVYKGFRFDLGGHRFFTKNPEVERLWREFLPEGLLEVQRMSRIYYGGRFFDYPLRASNALANLGLGKSALCLLSCMHRRLLPIRPERSFRDWVSNRFGDRLFRTFFESYTEKVWGLSCEEISADWAAQRIRGLSLLGAVRGMFSSRPARRNGEVVKTLVDRFLYPRLGPGMMWEAVRDRVQQAGGAVEMDRTVTSLEHDGTAVRCVVCRDRRGRTHRFPAGEVISSIPLRELVLGLDPPPPPEIRSAARALRYRDFITVALILDRPDPFPDNWIYVHEPAVKVGRVQNFRSWSREMVPHADRSVLGLEYFCFQGDGLWSASDAALLERGRRELERIGLLGAGEVVDGTVVRVAKAYPLYDEGYRANVDRIRRWLARLGNLRPAGRNGMHKYNNQDHSMMTALLCARNLLGTDARDPWRVNTDAIYHEEIREDHDIAGRDSPRPLTEA